MMKIRSILIIQCLGLSSPAVFAQQVQQLPEVTVEGEAIEDVITVSPETAPGGGGAPDVGRLLQSAPGAGLNFNGQLSGQPQYRGMFGPRTNVRLDGTHLESGGPNWMDPPLHYMPSSLLESLELYRGIAPVSSGQGIGGYVEATGKRAKFGETEKFEFHGDASVEGHSVDDGYGLGGFLGLSNNRHRFQFLGSRDEGGDSEFGGGTTAGTEYERNTYGGGYGIKFGPHEFSVDYLKTKTDNAGTPALPLDIAFFDTDRVKGHYKGEWNGIGLDAKIYYTDVEHQMNNFSIRPAPNFFEAPTPIPFFAGEDRRFVDADGTDLGYSVKATYPIWGGDLAVGADGHMAEHNATVNDPDFAKFFLTNFNDAEYDTYGFFGEWRGEVFPNWGLELGVRYNRVETDAGDVNAFPATLADKGLGGKPAKAVQTLRDRFNTADRSQSDNNVDAVVKLNYEVRPEITVEAGFARKVRSPSYIERYLWIPLEVNAGLGDGNNYVGNPELDPETSYEVEIGFNWTHDRFYFSPRGFYRWVDDFIQGVPATDPAVLGVSNASGDSTPLQFANIDARIWGFDALFGVKLADRWRIDGVASFVRGRGQDIPVTEGGVTREVDDNLYRIQPPNICLGFTHERETWSATLETVLVDRQDKISRTIAGSLDPVRRTNNDSDTPGYVLLNLYGQWTPSPGVHVGFGIDNLLDKTYTDHLSGFNRHLDSDVPVGVRLPGLGRNIFARVSYEW